MSYKHSLQDAIDANANGELRAWVINYLEGEGDNRNLVASIKDHPYAVVLLKEYPLDRLLRTCGPEESMLWRESQEVWENKLSELKASVRNGYKLPPLIVTDFWGLHVSDGNHRHGALKEIGFVKYWTVFLLDNPDAIGQE